MPKLPNAAKTPPMRIVPLLSRTGKTIIRAPTSSRPRLVSIPFA